MIEVRMPQLGETTTEGTIIQWFKSIGDTVTEDEALFEVSTDKVDAEVPALFGGTVAEIRVAVGETVSVGTVVAVIDGGDETNIQLVPKATTQESESSVEFSAEFTASPPRTMSVAAASPNPDRPLISPVVRKMIKQLGLDAYSIIGTGPGGRITVKDVEATTLSEVKSPVGQSDAPPLGSASHDAVAATANGFNFVAFNKTRKLTGDRMVASRMTSPHVMTATEVDYERIELIRRSHQNSWKQDKGITLTYLPFVCRALVESLHEFPYVNASVVKDGLVLHEQIDLNIAIDLDFEGLVAPVIRQAQDKQLSAIASEVSDLAIRARTRKLRAEELRGGTFTVSNSGPFGTFMVAPVINQPQVAILSTDGVTRRPVVVADIDGGESIAIHSVGMLVLSWDHRAFDGAYAAAFLRSVKRILENHDWELEF